MLFTLIPRLILVGGFLGAGKTTLLLAAGARLRAMGRRVGIIVNDQGGELVDTRLAEAAGFDTAEITGGCFCCRFADFVQAAARWPDRPERPQFLLAEPVGSCADLSATILQPIKKFYGDQLHLAPLTVLVDPQRAEELLRTDADPLLSYLFRKQIAEADLVRFSKWDRHDHFPALDGAVARPLSARTGAGVSEWLDEVLSGAVPSGSRLLEIDYQRYAAAEAALGWFNWQADLRLRRALTPAAVTGPLVQRLDELLTEAGVPIAHLKVLAQSADGFVRAGVCRNGEQPSIDGALDAPPAWRYELVLNLRATGAPELLAGLVSQAAKDLPGRLAVRHQQSFRPPAPLPQHRFQEIYENH